MMASKLYGFDTKESDASNVDDDESIDQNIYDEGAQLRRIPCVLISTDGLCYRDDAEWSSDSYFNLRADIDRTGGNIEPVLVRRITRDDGRGGDYEYELLSGLRRYMACRDLKIRVVAVVVCEGYEWCTKLATSNDVFYKKLSNFEKSVIANRMRSLNVAKTAKEIAKYFGVGPSNMAKIMILSELPKEILDCFVDKSKIHVAWGGRLRTAYCANKEAVLQCARKIVESGCFGKAKDIFEELLLAAGMTVTKNKEEAVFVKGGIAVAEILQRTDAKGRTLLAIDTANAGLLEHIIKSLAEVGAELVTPSLTVDYIPYP